MRLWVINKAGTWVATAKGVSVPIDQLGELSEAVTKLRQAVERTEPRA